MIGVYKPPGPKSTRQLNSKKTLGCHAPIELSRILNNFLRANTENNLFVKALKYSHFELNNITIEKNKFPRLV